MSTDVLGIIDSAVKIGLGALISGVTTYYVTRANHRGELEKQFNARRLEALEKSAEHFDAYANALSMLISAIHGVVKKSDKGISDEARAFIQKNDSEYCSIRPNRDLAISRLRILGINKAATVIEEIADVDRQVRELTMFQRKLPTETQLDAWRTRMRDIRARLYEILASEYRA